MIDQVVQFGGNIVKDAAPVILTAAAAGISSLPILPVIGGVIILGTAGALLSKLTED